MQDAAASRSVESIESIIEEIERSPGTAKQYIDVVLTSLDAMIQKDLTGRFAQGLLTQQAFNRHLLKLKALVALGREIIEE